MALPGTVPGDAHLPVETAFGKPLTGFPVLLDETRFTVIPLAIASA